MKRLLVFFCFILSYTVYSQIPDNELYEMSLEELMRVKVVTSSKNEAFFENSPGVISVITAKEIELFGASDLYDVIERFVSIIPYWNFNFYKGSLSVRGDMPSPQSSHFLILINGRPYRETVFGGLNINILNTFPLEVVERIEFLHGSGSVLYGTNAVNGVFNIITKKEANKVSFSLGADNIKGIRINAGVNRNLGKEFKISANMKYKYSNGFDFNSNLFDGKDSIGNDIILNKKTKYGLNNGLSGFLDIGGENLYLRTYVGILDMKTFTNSSGKKDSELLNNRLFTDLGYHVSFIKNLNHELNLTLNIMQFDFRVEDLPLEQTTKAFAREIVIEENNKYMVNDKLDFMLGGLVYFRNGHREFLGNSVLDEFNTMWFSIYSQLEYQVLNSLKITGGLQSNKVDNIDWTITPRIGLNLKINENFGIKHFYSEAFRSANQSEIDATLIFAKGNNELLPEISKTFDLQIYYHQKKSNLSLTLFHTIQEEQITRVPVFDDPPYRNTYINLGEFINKGIEFESKFIIGDDWLFKLNYFFQYNERSANLSRAESDSTYTTALSNYSTMPSHSLKAGVSYAHKKFSIGVYNFYYSKFHNGDGLIYINPNPDGYNNLSLNFNYYGNNSLQKKGFKINLAINNLLNQDIYFTDLGNRRINSYMAKSGIEAILRLIFEF